MNQAQRADAAPARRRNVRQAEAVLDDRDVLSVLEHDVDDNGDEAMRALVGIRNGVLISAIFWAVAAAVVVAIV